jgi:glycosyltransferase involved in cell wall biosynthesis
MKVVIAICAYNEERYIVASLKAAIETANQIGAKVVISLNKSTDATSALAKQASKYHEEHCDLIQQDLYLDAVSHYRWIIDYILNNHSPDYIIWCGADDLLLSDFHKIAHAKALGDHGRNRQSIYIGNYLQIDKVGTQIGSVSMRYSQYFSTKLRSLSSISRGRMPNQNGSWLPSLVYQEYLSEAYDQDGTCKFSGTASDLYIFWMGAVRFPFVYQDLAQVAYRVNHHQVRPWQRSQIEVLRGQLEFADWLITRQLIRLHQANINMPINSINKFVDSLLLKAFSKFDAQYIMTLVDYWTPKAGFYVQLISMIYKNNHFLGRVLSKMTISINRWPRRLGKILLDFPLFRYIIHFLHHP